MQMSERQQFRNGGGTTTTGRTPDGMNSGNATGISQITSVCVPANQAAQVPGATRENGNRDDVVPHAKRKSRVLAWANVGCRIAEHDAVILANGQKQNPQRKRGCIRQQNVQKAITYLHGITCK